MINNPQDILQKDLIAELGLEALPQDKKEKLILRIGQLVHQNVILRILGELSETDKDEFEKVLAENDEEKTLAFLQSKIPNLEEMVKEEIIKFKQEAVAKSQAIFA